MKQKDSTTMLKKRRLLSSFISAMFLIIFVNSGRSEIDTLKSQRNKLRYGINLGSVISQSTNGIGYYVNLQVEKGLNLFSCGPLFSDRSLVCGDQLSGYWNRDKYLINGLEALYQIRANSEPKNLDFFFFSQFIFLNYKDQKANYYSPAYSTGIERGIETIRYKTFEGGVGYGIKINFLRHFYLTNFNGVCYIYGKKSTSLNYFWPGYPSERQIHGFYFISNFVLGIKL